MTWTQFPRLLGALPRHGRWDSLRELSRLQDEMNRLFGRYSRSTTGREFPPVQVWTGVEGAVLVALVPGCDPGAIDLSVSGDTLAIKGERGGMEMDAEATWHRQERGAGRFARAFSLPFDIDVERVEASFKDGVLQVKLPRTEAQKPKKIEVVTS